MVTPLAVANGANLALGVFLFVLAALVLRKSPDRQARGPLALYLGLVGSNYALDGLAFAATSLGLDETPLRFAALLVVFLDPPLLLVFAMVVAFGPMSRTRKALIGAPALAVALLFVALPPSAPFMSFWRLKGLYLAELASYYLLAFAFLAHAYLRETRTLQRDRLGTLVVAFGIITLPRIPLLLIDFGFRNSATTFLPAWAVALMVAGLGAILTVTLVGFALGATDPNREHTTRSGRALAGLLTVVAAMWVLLLVPGLTSPAFAMVFSFRWYLFAAVFSAGVRRHDLLDLSETAHARIRSAFTGVLYALAIAQLAAILLVLPGATFPLALGGSLGIVLVGAVGHAALRQANPLPPTDVAIRRATLYRAHVELGTPPHELAALRDRLGLNEREAREVEALVALERAAPKPAAELAEGMTALGRYEIQRVVGAGSFGRAFLAWDRLAGERVVVKELLAAWRNDPEALERFRREARVALRVSHPNLVGFRALEPTSGGHLLVLEYVEGEPLRERIARCGRLDAAHLARVADDLMAGLGALHDAGIVHRDVKPDNVVLRPDGRAVLLDFGAATHAATGTLPASGNPGTRAYMAPEQARGERVGPAADLYAAAVTLWEAGAGAPPPRGQLVAPPLRTPLERGLEPEPAARWPDAAAFRAALRAAAATSPPRG